MGRLSGTVPMPAAFSVGMWVSAILPATAPRPASEALPATGALSAGFVLGMPPLAAEASTLLIGGTPAVSDCVSPV